MLKSIPRVLEIGEFHHFKDLFPEQTTFLWTGRRRLHQGPYEAAVACTPRRFARAMRELHAGQYDLVVAYAALRSPWHPRYWLRSWMREPLRPISAMGRLFGVSALRFVDIPVPLVALDLNDAFTIGGHNFFLLDKARLYFKRELPSDRWNAIYGSAHPFLPTRRIRGSRRWQERLERLRPIGLFAGIDGGGFHDGEFPEKAVDVFFSGSVEMNSWVRHAGLKELKRLAERGIKLDVPAELLPLDEYRRRMARAWLVWSPSGFGWECFRHLEVPHSLSVPLINQPTIERYQPLRDGVHAVYYDIEPGGLTRAVEAALADKDKLKRMAVAARAHVLTHHSPRALAEYVFEAVGLLGPSSK
jgi:hypothetical protein